MNINLINSQMLLSDVWVDGFIGSTVDIEIQYKYNCGESITLSPTLGDVNVDNEIVIDLLGGGVYYVVLKNITDPQNPESKTLCVTYITEETKCQIQETYAEECNEKIIGYYMALSLVANCQECNCDKACKIYDKLINSLNNECNC